MTHTLNPISPPSASTLYHPPNPFNSNISRKSVRSSWKAKPSNYRLYLSPPFENGDSNVYSGIPQDKNVSAQSHRHTIAAHMVLSSSTMSQIKVSLLHYSDKLTL